MSHTKAMARNRSASSGDSRCTRLTMSSVGFIDEIVDLLVDIALVTPADQE